MTVLVVGGGKMGMSHLALATQYIGKSNVALCDTKFSTRLLFRFLGYRTFASVDAAAKHLDRLSGVLIATPTASHAALARWAIRKRVPCFVEKPLTLNVKSSEELTALADAAGIPVQVGFVMRYVASFQRLRQLVKNQSLGQLLGYQASMRGNVITKPPAPSSWQSDFARGGGCLNEYGPHIIDLCRFIFGSVREVGAVQVGRVYSSRADDRISIDCTHENATPGQINIDWCDKTKRKSVIEFNVRFEHANVRVDNSAVEIDWHENGLLPPQARAQVDVPVQPQNVGYYLRGEEFSLELEEFLGVCVGRYLGGDESLADDTTPRLKDGCAVDQLIDEIARKAGLK
jgi:scyllo-inositol 2-dehydrogenase (NADP+)